jgi:5-methylcytosine-specific restriction endonuclease McrA
VPSKDPEKIKAARRRHYQRHKEAVVAKVSARKKSIREWWREFKATLVCWHCGESHPDCIDLHHVITTGKTGKNDTSSNWANHHGRSKARVMRDIQDCVPLCSNCHRKVHAMHREILREEAERAGQR